MTPLDEIRHMAEELARQFHEAYERLAPSFGYETRKESAVPWDDVPEQNRSLMVAVCAEVLSDRVLAAEQHAQAESETNQRLHERVAMLERIAMAAMRYERSFPTDEDRKALIKAVADWKRETNTCGESGCLEQAEDGRAYCAAHYGTTS